MDACDLWALSWHCIKSRNDSVVKITARDEQHFQELLSVRTVHHKCKEEAECELDPETPPSFFSEAKWKTVV